MLTKKEKATMRKIRRATEAAIARAREQQVGDDGRDWSKINLVVIEQVENEFGRKSLTGLIEGVSTQDKQFNQWLHFMVLEETGESVGFVSVITIDDSIKKTVRTA